MAVRIPASDEVQSVPEGVVLGENLAILESLPDECVDLVDIDPPFGTGQTRTLESIKLGQGDGSRTGFAGRTYSYDIISRLRYSDDMPVDEYLYSSSVALAKSTAFFGPAARCTCTLTSTASTTPVSCSTGSSVQSGF